MSHIWSKVPIGKTTIKQKRTVKIKYNPIYIGGYEKPPCKKLILKTKKGSSKKK